MAITVEAMAGLRMTQLLEERKARSTALGMGSGINASIFGLYFGAASTILNFPPPMVSWIQFGFGILGFLTVVAMFLNDVNALKGANKAAKAGVDLVGEVSSPFHDHQTKFGLPSLIVWLIMWSAAFIWLACIVNTFTPVLPYLTRVMSG